MAGHPNEDLLRRGYDAFSRGDMATLRELIASDAVWHQPGTSPLAGHYEGIDAILEYFMDLFQRSEGTFKVELHDVLADDEHGVALQHATAQRSGKTWDSNDVIVFHVSDGKTTAAWFHPGDQYAFDAFWSD